MEELLQRLEKKIMELIDQRDRLNHSNLQLNLGKFAIAREKELLISKQQKAITQIESLVAKLKAIEKIP